MPLLGITMQDVKRVFLVDDQQSRNSPENPSVSLSQPGSWLSTLFAGPVASGVAVNQESLLGITAAWRCLKVLGENVASLGGDVMRDLEDGTRKKFPNHRVSKILRDPSPLYTGFTFRETMTAYAAGHGNGIARIENDGTLTIIRPDTVETKYKEGVLTYHWRDKDGNKQTAFDYQIFHIPGLVMGEGEVLGKSPLSVHRETLGLNIAQTLYGAKFFKNGAHIDGFLSTEQKLSPEAIKRMANSWRARYTGVNNTGSTPVLEEGLKYVPLSLSPQDALFVEATQLSVQEIARIFGVPLHMLASLENATFSNIEHQSREFVTYTLRPWVKKYEAEINRKLFTQRERDLGYYYRFNLESLLRGDSEAQARLIDTYMKWGITTRDEIRQMYGWNPSQDDTGKTHFVPVNMVPADQAGMQAEIPFPEPENNNDNE